MTSDSIRVLCTYSRHTAPKMYVQDMIRTEAETIKRILANECVVYVCGDGNRMAKDVWQCFVELCGKDKMDTLKKDGKYLEDVWS